MRIAKRFLLKSIIVYLILLSCSAIGEQVYAQSGGPFDIKTYTINSGGTVSGGNFTLSGTNGQLNTGDSSGVEFDVSAGYHECVVPVRIVDTSLVDAGSGTLQLSWPGTGTYDVWQNEAPYFMAGDAGASVVGDDVTSPISISGIIGVPDSSYFFQVVSENGCGRSNPSNRTGVFNLALTPGN